MKSVEYSHKAELAALQIALLKSASSNSPAVLLIGISKPCLKIIMSQHLKLVYLLIFCYLYIDFSRLFTNLVLGFYLKI